MFIVISGLQWVTVILALLGKAGVTAAYAVIYVWTAELFPTVIRNVGVGASSFCANVGGVIAPYIADLVRNMTSRCCYSNCSSYVGPQSLC